MRPFRGWRLMARTRTARVVAIALVALSVLVVSAAAPSGRAARWQDGSLGTGRAAPFVTPSGEPGQTEQSSDVTAAQTAGDVEPLPAAEGLAELRKAADTPPAILVDADGHLRSVAAPPGKALRPVPGCARDRRRAERRGGLRQPVRAGVRPAARPAGEAVPRGRARRRRQGGAVPARDRWRARPRRRPHRDGRRRGPRVERLGRDPGGNADRRLGADLRVTGRRHRDRRGRAAARPRRGDAFRRRDQTVAVRAADDRRARPGPATGQRGW